MKPTDLTPQFPLLSAEEELYVPPQVGDLPGQMLGGWRADAHQLSQGKIQLQATNERILVGSAAEPMSGIGIFLGKDNTDYEFRVGDPSGQYIHWDGSTLSVVGTLTATTGTIGGFSLGTDYIRDTANSFGLASTVSGSDDVRFWAGSAFADRATAPFRLTEAGLITATSGTIGGWTLSTTSLTGGNATLAASGNLTLGTSNDVVRLSADDATYRLWIGHATAASAPFRVGKDGAVTASNITITGGSVLSTTLNGLIALANLNIANRGWSQTSAFSVTDADTVAWASGTFTAADGTAYSISSGNTGNMATKTYIYLDTGVSTTAYQTTTTSSTAVGAGKVLIAIAQNGTNEASYQVMAGQGGQNIDAANIVAGSITANEIAASTITAGKLSIGTLSAIAADLGSITAGTIVLSSSGHIRSGQTDYNTGTGFWLGIHSSTAKFSIGNPSGKYLTWDGSDLVINGYIAMATASTTVTAKSANTTRTINAASFTKYKEFVIGVDGSYDVYFEIRNTTASGTTHGRIYKNGVAVGTDQTNATTSFVAFNETVSGLVVGDLIQFYGYKTIDNGEVCNFRLRAVLVPGATVNTD